MKYFLMFICILQFSCIQQKDTGFAPEISNHLRIFVTLSSTNGAIGPKANADAFCMNDPNHPAGGNFKALIAYSNGTRDLEHDWPLKPATKYYRLDGETEIGITDSSGKLVFNLTNSIDSMYRFVFSGFNIDWTVYAGNNCLDWTSSSGSDWVTEADPSATNSDMLTDLSVSTCTMPQSLYCVEY